MRDMHPQPVQLANLRQSEIEARPVLLELKLERADMSALGIARKFDDPAWRAQSCRAGARDRREEHVGLPAMLGLRDPHGVWSDVEHRLGRRVFEIPTFPPSVPGMRLFEILRSALLRAAAGRLIPRDRGRRGRPGTASGSRRSMPELPGATLATAPTGWCWWRAASRRVG